VGEDVKSSAGCGVATLLKHTRSADMSGGKHRHHAADRDHWDQADERCPVPRPAIAAQICNGGTAINGKGANTDSQRQPPRNARMVQFTVAVGAHDYA